MYRAVVAASLSLLFVIAGFTLVVPMASAQTECGTEGQPPCPPPGCGGEGQPPCATCGGEGQPPCAICHNIGGPRDLGANCDRGSGTCSLVTDSVTITLGPNQFLGIIIGAPAAGGALAAHLAHGDGFIQATFNPPLHLASEGLNHKAANVECLATRVVPQPPDHGN